MGPELKTEIQIPDLWFDFYARFLPGTAFVGLARTFIFLKTTMPSLSESVILVFLGFLTALLTQPLSSRIVGGIEAWAERKQGAGFVNRVTSELGFESRSSMIISKMHGEVTLYVQLAWLSLLYFVLELLHPPPTNRLGTWAFGLSALFLLYGFEVANRRIKRAIRHRTLLDTSVITGDNTLKLPERPLDVTTIPAKVIAADGTASEQIVGRERR
jgi:hypothetical protein